MKPTLTIAWIGCTARRVAQVHSMNGLGFEAGTSLRQMETSGLKPAVGEGRWHGQV